MSSTCCIGALKRHAPQHPALADLAGRWYVHNETGTGGPDELRIDVERKRGGITIIVAVLHWAFGAL